MLFSEVKVNARLEIELEDKEVRLIRGLVIDVDKKQDVFTIVDEYGNFITIEKTFVVGIEKVVLDKKILEAMYDFKNYYKEKEKHVLAIEELETAIPQLVENIRDARFLVHFNIHGASVRVKASLTEENLKFKSSNLLYDIGIDANLNNQLEIRIIAKNELEYYDVTDKDKLIEANAPDLKKILDKAFKVDVIEKSKGLNHIKDSLYHITTEYIILIPVSEDDYFAKKTFVVETIKKLRRDF